MVKCIGWKEDTNGNARDAACDLFLEILSTRRQDFPVEAVLYALSFVEDKVPYLSDCTRTSMSLPVFRLLKAIFLCTTRDRLHEHQLNFLKNGCFLHHLHAVVQGTMSKKAVQADELLFHKEMVMMTVVDSAEGLRVLGRIFPMPLVKKLDSAPHSTRLKDVSYDKPRSAHDNAGGSTTDSDQMALCTVFKPDRTNWQAFWMALCEQESGYNFIWNPDMLQQAQASLNQELTDLRLRSEEQPEWDYDGFRVLYDQLKDYLCVDGYYLQLLLESYQTSSPVHILHPVEFVRHLIDLFIVTRTLGDRRALLQLVYHVVYNEEAAVKDFPAITYLCFLLEEPALDPVLENLVLNSLLPLCKHQRNTEQIQEHRGVESLTILLARDVQLVVNNQQLPVEEALPKYFKETQQQLLLPALERVTVVLCILQSACNSMPRIRADLLSFTILPRLLRVPLLIADTTLLEILLNILTLSLATCPRAHSTIHHTGLFRILLQSACGRAGMHPDVAVLLYRYHLLQDTMDIQAAFQESGEKLDLASQLKTAEKDKEKQVALARKYSYLRFFLPQALIATLTREGPEKFCAIFNAERVETSDVLWSADLRALLSQELIRQSSTYVNDISTNFTVEWQYYPPEIILYEDIENKLCIHYVFLETFLQEECVLPYTVLPYEFLNELIRELELRLTAVHRMKVQPDEITYKDIDMILCSLLKLLRTKKEISHVEKRVFEVLGRCLTATLSVPNNLMMALNALEVIMEALCPQNSSAPVSVNICECADANTIDCFNNVLRECISDQLFDQLCDPNTLCSAVFLKTMSAIVTLAEHKNQRVLESLVAYPDFLHTLQLFIFIDNIEVIPQASLEVLRAFEIFLKDEKLLEIAVNSGIIIYLTQVAISLEFKTPIFQEIVERTVVCLELLAGVGNIIEPPTLVRDAMTQLLTPGLMKALRDHTMLEKMRSPGIRHPLLIWNVEMATFLCTVLAEEDEAIGRNEEAGNAYWDAQAFCRRGGYLKMYTNLEQECVVDEVFLEPFLQAPTTELTDPTPGHFMKELMENIVQLQNTSFLSRSQVGHEQTSHVLMSLRSLHALLVNTPTLYQEFVNDANIHRLFALLSSTTISWDLQKVLLQLLQLAVSQPNGCTILATIVPTLRILLESDCEQAYMPVLEILQQFVIHNHQVVESILSSALILVLLDMVLFFEKSYDGNVQDKAIILLGTLMTNFNHGEKVRSYLLALFTPLFRGEHEYSQDLLTCHENPGKLLATLNSNIYQPTVYWDDKVRDDLKQFLRSEARAMRTSDQDYEYAADLVSKRMKPARVTLNQQLVVSQIFIRQYVQSPFCEMDAMAFLRGLVEELERRVKQQRDSNKRDEDYCDLQRALNYFMLDAQEIPDASLCPAIVAFLVKVLHDNVVYAKDIALNTLKCVVEKPYGIAEFERNNCTAGESSYIVQLMVAASIEATTAYSVVEILKSLITQSPTLRETAYHAGILFYAMENVLGNAQDINTAGCVTRLYLDIINQLASNLPEAEEDLLKLTTSKFRGQFKKAASLINLFIRQQHEAFNEDGTIRVWSVTVRGALCELLREIVKKMNVDSNSTDGWDRKQNRFTLDEVNRLWSGFVKNEGLASGRSIAEESTALKRVTMVDPRTSPNQPIAPARPRTNSH